MRLTKSIILILMLTLLSVIDSRACTSAIISAEMNPYGRPILWKHRDTSAIDNKVEYIAGHPGELSYVALYNAADKELREAWIGMNEAGFAVMNTASYNIKDDKVPDNLMDKEGFVMTEALKRCRTVDDFACLLDSLPRPMGVEANFGVIDAMGNGAYFETNNHSYQRFDLRDAPQGVLVRTNYSHSGRKGEGYGHIREANAVHLLEPYIKTRSVAPEVLTEELSRTFYHDGKNRDFTNAHSTKVLDEDFIPRFKSTATVAIEGCKPQADLNKVTPEFVKNEYVMWTGLGYPPCAEIRGVTCDVNGVDGDLRGLKPNGHSKLADEAKALRNKVFISGKNKKNYLNIDKLYNSSGTGYTQKLLKKNRQNYMMMRRKRDGAD